ncbi:MAG: hypothetical protein FJ308_15040, partial [Planctomycetes bacterium]|nr:hypothetical protein [Planctomycetota bacterium]
MSVDILSPRKSAPTRSSGEPRPAYEGTATPEFSTPRTDALAHPSCEDRGAMVGEGAVTHPGGFQKGLSEELANSHFVRIGAVAYLNTKPLIYSLLDGLASAGRETYHSTSGPMGSLRLELPSRLATELENESLDVGLIPVV